MLHETTRVKLVNHTTHNSQTHYIGSIMVSDACLTPYIKTDDYSGKLEKLNVNYDSNTNSFKLEYNCHKCIINPYQSLTEHCKRMLDCSVNTNTVKPCRAEFEDSHTPTDAYHIALRDIYRGVKDDVAALHVNSAIAMFTSRNTLSVTDTKFLENFVSVIFYRSNRLKSHYYLDFITCSNDQKFYTDNYKTVKASKLQENSVVRSLYHDHRVYAVQHHTKNTIPLHVFHQVRGNSISHGFVTGSGVIVGLNNNAIP